MHVKGKSIILTIFIVSLSIVLSGCYTQLSNSGLNRYENEDDGYYVEEEIEDENVDDGIGVRYQADEADTHIVVHHVYNYNWDYDFYWDACWRNYYRPWHPQYTWYPYWRSYYHVYYDPWYWDYPYAYIDVFYWTPMSYYGGFGYYHGYHDWYYDHRSGDRYAQSLPNQPRAFGRRQQVERTTGTISPTRRNPRLAGAPTAITGTPRRLSRDGENTRISRRSINRTDTDTPRSLDKANVTGSDTRSKRLTRVGTSPEKKEGTIERRPVNDRNQQTTPSSPARQRVSPRSDDSRKSKAVERKSSSNARNRSSSSTGRESSSSSGNRSISRSSSSSSSSSSSASRSSSSQSSRSSSSTSSSSSSSSSSRGSSSSSESKTRK